MLVGFGQVVCLPVNPRCNECVLSTKGLCPSARVVTQKKKAGTTAGRKRKVEVEVEVDLGGPSGSGSAVKELETEGLLKMEEETDVKMEGTS